MNNESVPADWEQMLRNCVSQALYKIDSSMYGKGIVEETIVEQVRIILLAKDIERATLKDYEEKLWAACDTDEDTDALARILYKASVPQKESEKSISSKE